MLKPPVLPNRSPLLASAEWVEAHLPELVVLDGTFGGPSHEIDATQAYLACHIPNAQRFDIDVIKDTSNPLPHMLPSPADMSHHLEQLGIQHGDTIVVYDQRGLLGAPRVWWMLSAYGFDNVYILEGGLPRWLDEGRKTESGSVTRNASTIEVALRKNLLSVKADVQAALDRKQQVVDARAAARFAGLAPEPRVGLRAGHMPGAVNLPFGELVENNTFKNLDELENIIRRAGIEPDRPLISSCGSGVTAAFLCFALESLGKKNWSLYDGSWTEWGASTDCDVVRAA